jgi:hypothetical protein
MKTIKEFNAEVSSTKNGLLEQIDDCMNILLSKVENHEERLRMKEDALKLEHVKFFDNNEDYHLLAEKGYQTKNGGITLFYNETGKIQFAVRDLAIIYNMVKKKFPETAVSSNRTKNYTGMRSRTAQELMSIRTSFEDTQIAFDNAKHNYEQAIQSGNKGLIKVFTEHGTIEKECLKMAKNIDYDRIGNEKKYHASREFMGWRNEFNKNSSKYYQMGFSPITTDQYLALKQKELLHVPYEEAAVISDFLYSLKNGRCAGIDDYIAKNVTAIVNADMNLRTRFGRKDGNGFVKPKNQNEERSFRDMQNKLDKTKFIAKVMDSIFHVNEQKAAV